MMAAMLMAVMAGASREEGAYLPKTGSSSSDRWKVSSYELGSPPGACGQRVVPPIIVPPMIVSILPLAVELFERSTGPCAVKRLV